MATLVSPLITAAGPGDAAALARLHVQSWKETYGGILPAAYLEGLSTPIQTQRFARRLLLDSEFTLIAEEPDGLAGYCAGDWSRGRRGADARPEGEGEIHTLYVLQRAQGLGLGRALMTSAARVLADRGATSLVLWVLRDNRPARAFYERLGGLAQDYGGEWVGGAVVASVGYRWPDLRAWLAGM